MKLFHNFNATHLDQRIQPNYTCRLARKRLSEGRLFRHKYCKQRRAEYGFQFEAVYQYGDTCAGQLKAAREFHERFLSLERGKRGQKWLHTQEFH